LQEFGMQSVVWGIYCLARSGLRIGLLLASGVGSFVVVSFLTGTPFLIALVFWGIWHARRTFNAALDVAGRAKRAAVRPGDVSAGV
jgi:hypothetical protein